TAADSGGRLFGAARVRRSGARRPMARAAEAERRFTRGVVGFFIALSGCGKSGRHHVKPDRCAPIDRGQRGSTKPV
ncbi:hypothetical protein, partial [Burkholderia oklahomensis]|uniref:hypothetical protein n=1 Tax=Burkholderia oklahomensis TaxID=342113 RepID=UPI001E5C8703